VCLVEGVVVPLGLFCLFVGFGLVFVFFETYYIAQAGFKLMILLHQPPECGPQKSIEAALFPKLPQVLSSFD
jgi:hypothetical protein